MSQPAVPEPPEPVPSAPVSPPPVSPPPIPQVRASDADRERVAEIVHRAVGDGRLTLVEGDERLAGVYATVYRGELETFVADLGEPAPTTATEPARRAGTAPVTRPATTTSVAVMSGANRKGDWTPGLTHTAVAFMGGVELTFADARLGDDGLTIVAVAIMGGVQIDLRGADIGPAGVTVRAVAFWGGVEVVVDPGTRVEESGTGFMGGFDDSSGAPDRADGPVVRVTGIAIMAGVEVTRRPRGIDAEGRRELPDDGDGPRGIHGGHGGH